MTDPTPELRNELVPIAEACERLQVGQATLYRALKDNKIPGGRQLGNRWIIARAVFERWLVDGIEPAPPTRNALIVDIRDRKVAS